MDRFRTVPDVLPNLYYGEYNSELFESKLPQLHFFEDKVQETIPCVVRSKITGISLLRWLKSTRSQGEQFLGLNRLDEFLKIADSLFEAVHQLHTERATHGYIYPGNIIVPLNYSPGDPVYLINAAERNREVFFSDVAPESEARKYAIRRSFDPGESLYSYRDTTDGWSRFAVEDRVGYYSTTDIFAIGVTLAYLATGENDIFRVVSPYEHVVEWKDHPGWQIVKGRRTKAPYHLMKAVVIDAIKKSALKREGRNEATRDIYDAVVRISEIILQCVRSREDRRVLNSQHAQNVLRLFMPYQRHAYEPGELAKKIIDPRGLIEAMRTLSIACAEERNAFSKQIASGLLESGGPDSDKSSLPTLRDILALRLEATLQRTATLWPHATRAQQRSQVATFEPPSIRIVGSRDTLNEAFLVTLAGLPSNYECIALTTATVWNENNFGHTSRISSMIQLARMRDCVFKWIILVPTTSLFTPDVQKIMGFRSVDEQVMSKLPGPDGQRHYYPEAYFYTCLQPEEYEMLLAKKMTFIGFRKKAIGQGEEQDLELHIAPDFSGRDGKLVALTYWSDPRRKKRLVRIFNEYAQRKQPLSLFVRLL